jgi:uncharacterized membrane protein HdeD (DUF308 family)
MSSHASTDTDPMTERLSQVAGSPGLSLGAGVLSIVIGVLILAWPGATIVVIAILFAIQVIIAGVLQIVAAFSADGGAGSRVLLGLLGALSILVGLLCLRAPLQTAVALGLLIGAVWVVGGVIGFVHAVGAERGGARGWAIVSAVISVIAGVVVLVYPGMSIVVLTWLLGIVLVVNGAVLVARAFALRRSGRHAGRAAAPAGPAAASPM